MHVAPFFSHRRGIAYAIAWPAQDLAAGASCTRDLLPGVAEGNAYAT
jgi:hypothetical protein